METQFEHAYVLSVMSDDHPGIVAGLTGAVSRLRGNIDACSQTVLGGYFTLIMIVSLPEPADPEALAEAVRSRSPGCHVLAAPYDPAAVAAAHAPCERFVLTAFGEDRRGIVERFTGCLAGKDINILDLYGERTEGDFVLVGQVEIPPEADLALLQADLEAIAAEAGFTVRLQHENVFVATNQLRMTPQR